MLAEIAGALGADREIVLVPGNHDHGLLRGWLERRDPTPLGLEIPVAWDSREPLGAVVAALEPASVRVAYPGCGCARMCMRLTATMVIATTPCRFSSGSAPG